MAIVFTSNLDLKTNRVTNVGAPAQAADAATKQYVDNIATGLVWKDAVRAASTSNVSIATPPSSIDGVTLAANDRVLLMGQTTASQNGIYVYNGGGSPLTRPADADTAAELRPGSAVYVSEGTATANHTYVLTTDGPITLDTTALSFALLNAGTAPVYTAGNGIDITSNAVSAVAAANAGISVSPSGIAVVADAAGGLQTGTNGIAAKLNATASGLAVDSNGLTVLAKPNRGLAVTATGVDTVLNGTGGLAVDASGLAVKLVAAGGLATDASGSKVLLDAAGGLTSTASGVKAVAGTGIVVGTDIAIDTTKIPQKFSAAVGDGSATTLVVNHNLGTRDVTVQVYSTAAPYDTVYAEVQRTDVNNVSLLFGTAPTSGEYRAVVVG